jgi:hypothetical protein
MFVTLLFAASLMLFIADRKVSRAFISGILVVFLANLPFARLTYFICYKIKDFAEKHLPAFGKLHHRIAYMLIAVLFTVLFTAILMNLGKLWSKDIFTSSNGIKNEKLARTLVTTSSVIIIAVVLWLVFNKFIAFGKNSYFMTLMGIIGHNFVFYRPVMYLGLTDKTIQSVRIMNTVYVAILTGIGVFNIFWVNRKSNIFNILTLETSEKAVTDSGNLFSNISLIPSLCGLSTFMTVAQLGYIELAQFHNAQFSKPFYFSIYFGEYNETEKIFTKTDRVGFVNALVVILISGIILLISNLIYKIAKKEIKQYRFTLFFSIAQIIVSVIFIIILLEDAAKFHSIP